MCRPCSQQNTLFIKSFLKIFLSVKSFTKYSLFSRRCGKLVDLVLYQCTHTYIIEGTKVGKHIIMTLTSPQWRCALCGQGDLGHRLYSSRRILYKNTTDDVCILVYKNTTDDTYFASSKSWFSADNPPSFT